jgi:two-component system cell cycle response regulator
MAHSPPTKLVIASAEPPGTNAWLAPLRDRGYTVAHCEPPVSRALIGDGRILVSAGDMSRVHEHYHADNRPTILIVQSAGEELSALDFIENSDDVWRADGNHAILTTRLQRVLARSRRESRFEQEANDWLARVPSDQFAALVYFDIDFFKYINDRFGWSAGDIVLREVEARLKEIARPEDKVIRLRGDEFVCLVARSDRDTVVDDAGRFQACVGSRLIALSSETVMVTASAGLTFMRPKRAYAAMCEASMASYMAKDSGRNDLLLYETLQQANEDGLTGLYNRRYFENRLKRELELANLHQTELSLALIDLDDFGLVNKRHGHPAGDLVLRKFAEVASQSVREIDWLARYGGEEFCLVARAPKAATAQVVDRIRRQIAGQLMLGLDNNPFAITISAGVVDCLGDASALVVQRASVALRQAKDAGKNGVIAH